MTRTLILAGDVSIPIMLNELRSVPQRTNTLLAFPSAGSDAPHFDAKEETFLIPRLKNGLWTYLLSQNEKSFASHCPCLNSERPSLSVNLEIKFFSGQSWLLHKFLLPLNKIPNRPSFVVKDTIIYILLWGVINIWIQRNNIWCSSLNMRICVSLCLSHH